MRGTVIIARGGMAERANSGRMSTKKTPDNPGILVDVAEPHPLPPGASPAIFRLDLYLAGGELL